MGPRQDQHPYQRDKAVEYQLGPVRTDEKHGNSADEVAEIVRPDVIRNNHHREKRHQRREQKTVDEDHQASLLQVFQLGMRDLAVHLGQGFFSAHGQHGVSETDK